MAQITAAEIKGYIVDQLMGYDKNVAKVKYSASASQKLDEDGNTTEFIILQDVDSEMKPKTLLHSKMPKGGSGSVEFETEDIDFDNDWDNGNKSAE